MANHEQQIVIVGGGIAGITAAYYLQQEIKTNNLPYQVLLIEATNELGGKINTLHQDGFTIERGPDSFLARKKSASRLAINVGLEDELVTVSSGQSFILANGSLHKMPQGSFMGIPTRVKPFLFSSLFSVRGKLRAAGDFVLPKSEPKDDQSLGEFFRRRLGDEVVENLIEPLLSGIYAGDIDRLSLMSTFPNFYHLEQKYRSLVKGLNYTMPKSPSNKPKQGMFLTLKRGLQSLVEAVEDKLDEGTVIKGTAVSHIEKKDDYYDLLLDSGQVVKARTVIMAAPHFVTQKLFSQYDFMKSFKEMPATSVANVAMAFDESDIERDIEGTGFVISRNSDHRITACTWTHKKWPHTTPKGKALLRCYVGRPNDQEVVQLSDDEIEEIVLKDLNKTMNIKAKPQFKVVTRWENAMPQYTVGHKDRLAEIKGQMNSYLPGVFLAGSSFEGIGIPDCIDQGEEAVKLVLDYLKN
ncbi:oxygen-dependent protoporphyrinogen oxidase [Salirhabdus euzebyi]|uniref:Coproporphyrinogen III oxidase n=1 Tax=Salirhabdus euzebyi TaxID=394506 RepID=A0A841Q8Q2_9BACI|nr:protoporphyrinogen oxidase [Salirhabdus euzebyi]MBB6454694.1 oxygen-dependent protoporphyrinogen oxidase [Salirhabdus euzebyi]